MSHWQNKIIAITGGSNGLGLEMATHFAAAGAQVIIIARDQQRLTAVCQDTPNLHPVVADIMQTEQVNTALSLIHS